MSFLIGDIINLPLTPDIAGGAAPAVTEVVQQAPSPYELYMALQGQLVMYQLLCLLLGFVLIVLLIVFLPMFPWAISKMLTKKTLIALMDKTRNVKFTGGFSLRNGMYHHKDKPLYFVKKYPGVFYFAGVPFDYCNIDLAFVQHPIYNTFVATLRDAGYKDWKSIETALEFNTIEPSDEATIKELGYDSYEHAQKVLNPLKLTRKSEILAPYFSSCPLDELIGYGADVPPSSIAGEVDDVVQSQKSPEMKNLVTQYLPMAIFIMIVLIGAAIAYAIIQKV
jgi:hypothetical protein